MPTGAAVLEWVWRLGGGGGGGGADRRRMLNQGCPGAPGTHCCPVTALGIHRPLRGSLHSGHARKGPLGQSGPINAEKPLYRGSFLSYAGLGWTSLGRAALRKARQRKEREEKKREGEKKKKKTTLFAL